MFFVICPSFDEENEKNIEKKSVQLMIDAEMCQEGMARIFKKKVY